MVNFNPTLDREDSMIASRGEAWVKSVYVQSANQILLKYDFTEVVKAIDAMRPSLLKRTFKKIFRQAGTRIRKPVQNEVKARFPGGKQYPRNPGRRSGYWRGKQYGPLYKAVRLNVYKNAKGVNVNIYTPQNGKADRQAILGWLQFGTNERGNKRSKYQRSKGKYTFIQAGGTQYRGRIQPTDFFSVAYASLVDAEKFASNNFEKAIIQAYNKQKAEA